MNKEFIPYEEALALKELGFDGECFRHYNVTGGMSNNEVYFETELVSIPAPLYQQAFRWFREKYDLHIGICHQMNGKFDCWTNKGNLLENGKYCDIDSYEEAELACLKKLIEIVNQNKEDE